MIIHVVYDGVNVCGGVLLLLYVRLCGNIHISMLVASKLMLTYKLYINLKTQYVYDNECDMKCMAYA